MVNDKENNAAAAMAAVPAFDAKQIFGGKKITLMGLGLLGRGLGDAKFFAEAGAHLIITDLKDEAELETSLEQLKGFPTITYHLGGHRLGDFENRDLIIRAPNAPLDSLFLARARAEKIPIEMDASLFVEIAASFFPNVTIIGVTGTRGKSTTTHLIYEMVRAAGGGKKVYIGGNERDTATLPLLGQIADGDIVILELDSWQLQGFAESRISPHISIWTNFMPDHMNYYHGDMDRYFQDKAAIARFQKTGDTFIAPTDIKEKIESRFGALAGTFIDPLATASDNASTTASNSISKTSTPGGTGSVLPADWQIALLGQHNRKNAAFARAAAHKLGISDEIVKKVLMNFSSLPNRIEFLDEHGGIEYYNDSNSTTPEATIVALRALAPKKKPIVLIAGGSDKELDFAGLAKEIAGQNVNDGGDSKAAHVKNLILFEGKATEKLKALLPENFPITMVATMDEAVKAARATAAPGDIILLSPGATSFGIFKNEYDRGEQFRKACL